MVLLRSCNLKIELRRDSKQNGVQRNLGQESQLLSEPHSSTAGAAPFDQHFVSLSSLEPERNEVFYTNVCVFCIW